jgi:putative ABC transport system substrate-binding protein
MIIRRREFIAGLGGAAAWLMAAKAQQAPKLPTIGFLASSTQSDESQRIAAFLQRLREAGWIEGRNVAIDFRFAEGQMERLLGLATELAQRQVNVIVTDSTPAVIAAKQATSTVPIVFAAAGDPVAAGLVASLARPGGNVTGLSLQQRDLGGKRLALLREALPGLRHVAVMAELDNPIVKLEVGELEAIGRALGLEMITVPIQRGEEIAPAFEAIKGRADALYVPSSPLVNANRIRIGTWSLAARLPTIHTSRENVALGGVISYAPNFLDLFRRSADIVDKIMRGTKPADIPVEQPTRFDFIVNLMAAKALGLEIPSALLTRADEVIE